jgi:glycosyltransferase involved in cell wall biosynthesis
MNGLKISIITAVKNGYPLIKGCTKSFDQQTYFNKEQIFVYSKSEDKTHNYLIQHCKNNYKKIIYDNFTKNMYGALNLGIAQANGSIIGILHADDIFYDNKVLENVAHEFKKGIELVYGNIVFVKKTNIKKVLRVWKDKEFKKIMLYGGWMPAHTSVYIKKKVLIKNKYSNKYQIASDYDLMLTLFKNNNIRHKYLDKFLCRMRFGGKSTNYKYFFLKLFEDMKILFKHYKVLFLFIFFLKRFNKIKQFKILF